MSQLNTKLLQILKERNQNLVLPEPPGPGITDTLLNVAGTAGTVLDTPAALLRGALHGQPIEENLAAIFNPRERITGNELLGRPRGEFSWSGLGVEVLLDPLNALGVGTLTKAGQAAKAIKTVAPRLAAAKVTGKLDEVAELTERLRALKPIAESGPKRSLVALDIPFGPKQSLIESQAVNDVLSKTIGQPVGRLAATVAKPFKPYFSTDLGDPVLNAIRDIEKGSGRLAQLEGGRLGIGISKQVDELVAKTGLKEEEVFDLMTLAKETEEGITRYEAMILRDTEAITGAKGVKTVDEAIREVEVLKANPSSAVPRTPGGVLRTGNIVDDQLKAEAKVLRKVESIETKIARLNEFTERLKKVPEPIAQFARQFGDTLDPSFLKAAAEGTPFAKRKGVIGYLHRYLTPDGIKLLEDTKFIDELNARFDSNFKSVKLKVSEEGVQKPRSRKLENELLVDINQFAKEYTGRNINFFENDPAKIAHHYYRHLKRAEIKTNLLQALMKHFMREKVRVKGVKGGKPALLRLAKGEITLDKIIKPYANKPARITRFGDAVWDAKASRKDIAKALKAAGLHKFVINQSDYKQFQKVFDAVLGTPKDFRRELMLYDQILNVYRSALTSFFPAFAVRNLISGIAMNVMAGVMNPAKYIEAIHLIRRGLHDSRMAAAELNAPSIFAAMKELPIKGTPNLKAWSAQYLDKAQELYPSYAAYLRTLYDAGDLPKFLTTVATFEALSPVMKASFKKFSKDLPIIDGVPFASFIKQVYDETYRGQADITRRNDSILSKIKLSSSASQSTFAHELFHNIFRAFFPNDLKEQMLDDLFRNFTPEELERIVGVDISKLYISNIIDTKGLNDKLQELEVLGILPQELRKNPYSQETINFLQKKLPGYTGLPITSETDKIYEVITTIQKVRRTVGEEFLANFTGAEFLIKGLRQLRDTAPQFKLVADDIEILINNHKSIVDNYIKAIRSIRVGKAPDVGKFINNYMRNLSKPKYHFDTDISSKYYSSPFSQASEDLDEIFEQFNPEQLEQLLNRKLIPEHDSIMPNAGTIWDGVTADLNIMIGNGEIPGIFRDIKLSSKYINNLEAWLGKRYAKVSLETQNKLNDTIQKLWLLRGEIGNKLPGRKGGTASLAPSKLSQDEILPTDPYIGYHLSSNLESLKNGLQKRKLGFSIARNSDELLSSPTLSEASGTSGLVKMQVWGKGLDYSNPKHAQLIDNIFEEAYKLRQQGQQIGIDTYTIEQLRKQGYAWINNFNGIGLSDELHIINPDFVKIVSKQSLVRDKNLIQNARKLMDQGGTASLAPSKSLPLFDRLYADGVIAGGQTQEIRDLLESALSTRGGRIAGGYRRAAENPIEFATRGKLHPTFAPLGYEGNQNIENVVRVAHYLDKRAKGLTHVEAVASVKKYLFDYRDLTSFEKNYMRRVFLFYTWTRKNIPLMMSALVEHPRFMANYLRATGQMNPEAQRKRPKWLPDSFHISRNNGKELAMALGLPMEDLSRYDPEGQGIGRSLQKLVGEMVPPISAPAELMSGRNTFTGRPLEGGLGERLLSESPLSRAGTTVSQLVSPPEGKTRASVLVSQLTGVNFRRIDEKRSEKQNALADLEVRLNRMWRQGRVRKMDDYTYRTVNGEKLDQDLVKKLLSTQGKIRQSLKE